MRHTQAKQSLCATRARTWCVGLRQCVPDRCGERPRFRVLQRRVVRGCLCVGRTGGCGCLLLYGGGCCLWWLRGRVGARAVARQKMRVQLRDGLACGGPIELLSTKACAHIASTHCSNLLRACALSVRLRGHAASTPTCAACGLHQGPRHCLCIYC